MNTIVHHQPLTGGLSWNMHVWEAAWDGNQVWDVPATLGGTTVDFQLPDVPDVRALQFKYNSTSSATGQTVWEADDFIRRAFLAAPNEIWTFISSARVLYTNPSPAGAIFHAGDVLTVRVITESRFRGGKIFTWNPYDPTNPSAYFPESARDDASKTSTFQVTLADWMIAGFHLKLMCPGANGQQDVWEPDASNRVWRPCDGNALWLKSGQNDVRSQPLAVTSCALELLFPATLPGAPMLTLLDTTEGISLPLAATATQPYAGDRLFQVAAYAVNIYPGASYTVSTQNNVENPPLSRPFPADPANAGVTSRFVLGAGDWISDGQGTGLAHAAFQRRADAVHGPGGRGNSVLLLRQQRTSPQSAAA
jgi:hypothetical protein